MFHSRSKQTCWLFSTLLEPKPSLTAHSAEFLRRGGFTLTPSHPAPGTMLHPLTLTRKKTVAVPDDDTLGQLSGYIFCTQHFQWTWKMTRRFLHSIAPLPSCSFKSGSGVAVLEACREGEQATAWSLASSCRKETGQGSRPGRPWRGGPCSRCGSLYGQCNLWMGQTGKESKLFYNGRQKIPNAEVTKAHKHRNSGQIGTPSNADAFRWMNKYKIRNRLLYLLPAGNI